MTTYDLTSSWDAAKGEQLRLVAESLGFSLPALAKHAGSSKYAVERVYHNWRPDLDVVARLVEALDLSNADTRVLTALARTCKNWSTAHAAALKDRITEMGLDLDSAAALTGVSKASLHRWVGNQTRPRVNRFAIVAQALKIDVLSFSELEGSRVGEDLNPFAAELERLKAANSWSIREMSDLLGVHVSSLQACLEGRSFPESGTEARAKLEILTGISIAGLKRDEAFASEVRTTDLTALTGLPRLLVSRRFELGLTQPELAERLGSSLDVIRAWEAGEQRPTYERLRALASVLEVGTDEVALATQALPEERDFHSRLKAARKRVLLSGTEVADAVGIAHFVYNRYEGAPSADGRVGAFPSYSEGRLEAICEVLSVEVEDLFEPDLTVFGHWVGALADVHGLELVASVAGAKTSVVLSWARGESRPSTVQAEALGHFSGDGKVFARSLVTGEPCAG